jgi:methylenetetrahydrofolate dehydrogenase (NADP+)/methenyltetrahydrofolate cyclohydrolase
MEGRVVAQRVKSKIAERVRQLGGSDIKPSLVAVMVGENPASRAYLERIQAACSEVGFVSGISELPLDTSQENLLRILGEFNDDDAVNGILLQLPLPKGLDEVVAVSNMDPEKDVDGLHPRNLGLLMENRAGLVPCTPKGVIALLNYYGTKIAGSHVVIINRSKIVGRPLSQLLLNQDATVSICHSKTKDLRSISSEGDILVTAIGHRSEFTVGADMVKKGAVVVDVGMTNVGGKLVGDVDFDSAIKVAEYVTPVPGGVGPMTIAMLLYNTLLATCMQNDVELGFSPDELNQPE